MVSRVITVPELGLIAGTRVALGVGLGLLLSNRLHPESRRAAGWSLLAVGALSTIPLAVDVLLGRKSSDVILPRAQAAPGERMEAEWSERVPAAEL